MAEQKQPLLRRNLIQKTDEAIGVVRDLVAQLSDEEKTHMQRNSVAYRQLVDAVAEWAGHQPALKPITEQQRAELLKGTDWSRYDLEDT